MVLDEKKLGGKHMTVKNRIEKIRFIEKAKKHPQYVKKELRIKVVYGGKINE